MTFFYYNRQTKENLTFRALNRENAIKRIQKLTKEPWYEIDKFLKSDLQMATLQGFRITK